MTDLITRLSDEADQCRNDGADDIARLLDEAAAALRQPGPALVAAAKQALEALEASLAAMEHMGDALNAIDAVADDDEKHYPAFDKARDSITALRDALSAQPAEPVAVPDGLSRSDAEFWLRHRAEIIEALEVEGYRIVSIANKVSLMDFDLDRIERDLAAPAAPAPQPAERWPGDDHIESPFNACQHRGYCLSLKAASPAAPAAPAAPVEPVGEHDSLRDNIGQAISDVLTGWYGTEDGAMGVDPFDSRNIDEIADAVIRVLPAAPAAPAAQAEPQKYDDTLMPFLHLMRGELHANAAKGDRPGWLQMDRNTALLEIYWHTAKLSAAVKNNDTARIAEHCADVGNMAMMLADVCGVLPGCAPAAPAASAEPVASLTDKWRDLALKFDRHRMAAMWHLRALLADPGAHAAAARAFLDEPPPAEPVAVPAQAWQPIETAPKDEKVVLWGDAGKQCFVGRWRDFHRINDPRITHWMPLPAAPAGHSQGGE